MDVGAGTVAGDGVSSTSSAISQWTFTLSQRYQHLLDKSTPQVLYRWIFLAVITFIFAIRVFMVQGFYIITYALGIYIIQLLIAFLSPQVDPEVEGPTLPTRGSDEFRPFVRRLPEFKFWYSLTKAVCIAFVLTFFSAFDVPVFWPILLFYWLVLFVSTMKRQIMHMVKYKYVPFTFGKQRYGKKVPSTDERSVSKP